MLEDDMPWYSFWDDVTGGWLKQRGRALPATFLFSAMHPLEGIKMLGSLLVTMLRSTCDKPLQVQFWDIHVFLFDGTAQREIYVHLPEEERDGEHCGLLVKSMYEAQDASAFWQDENTQVLEHAMCRKERRQRHTEVVRELNPAVFHFKQ